MLPSLYALKVNRVWSAMKLWRKLKVGPLSLINRFERTVPITDSRVVRVVCGASGRVEQLQQPRRGVALIVGVRPGLGGALAYRAADEGFEVILVSRSTARLAPLVHDIRQRGGTAFAYACDATLESSVQNLFALLRKHHRAPELVVYSIQNFGPGAGIDIEVPAFEDGWKHNCLGSFLVARGAARDMVQHGRGTIILIGSTSSLIGRDGHLNLAVGKFGQRALAQVLARELWPKGIHVAHVVVDADIQNSDASTDQSVHADPTHIAQTVLHLHDQPRSAWTSEIDLRPWNEKFWEHC